MFDNAKFVVCIEELDVPLEPQFKSIVLQYNQYRFFANALETIETTEYFIQSESFLTYREVIKQMVKLNISLKGDHIFLDGFNNLYDNVFEIIDGS